MIALPLVCSASSRSIDGSSEVVDRTRGVVREVETFGETTVSVSTGSGRGSLA